MKILFCTSSIDAELSDLLLRLASVFNSNFVMLHNAIDLNKIKSNEFDLLISDRNSIVLSRSQLEKFPFAINTHPSLLPSHKGSYPIFWSCIYGDDWGVTLHHLSEQIDQGPIISSVKIEYSADETFRVLYNRYREAVGFLLYEFMERIRSNDDLAYQFTDQFGPENHFRGNFLHKKMFTENLLKRLPHGWDTNVRTAQRLLKRDLEEYLKQETKCSEVGCEKRQIRV